MTNFISTKGIRVGKIGGFSRSVSLYGVTNFDNNLINERKKYVRGRNRVIKGKEHSTPLN